MFSSPLVPASSQLERSLHMPPPTRDRPPVSLRQTHKAPKIKVSHSITVGLSPLEVSCGQCGKRSFSSLIQAQRSWSKLILSIRQHARRHRTCHRGRRPSVSTRLPLQSLPHSVGPSLRFIVSLLIPRLKVTFTKPRREMLTS